MGSLFKRDPPPKPKPVLMPDLDSPVIKNTEDAKRRQIAARSGRTSTMLSQRADGGGGAYRHSLLGQAG